MSQLTIVPLGDAAAVILPEAAIESIGLRIGDHLDLVVGDQQLILRPVDEAARGNRLVEVTQEVIERRRDVYRRLA